MIEPFRQQRPDRGYCLPIAFLFAWLWTSCFALERSKVFYIPLKCGDELFPISASRRFSGPFKLLELMTESPALFLLSEKLFFAVNFFVNAMRRTIGAFFSRKDDYPSLLRVGFLRGAIPGLGSRICRSTAHRRLTRECLQWLVFPLLRNITIEGPSLNSLGQFTGINVTRPDVKSSSCSPIAPPRQPKMLCSIQVYTPPIRGRVPQPPTLNIPPFPR